MAKELPEMLWPLHVIRSLEPGSLPVAKWAFQLLRSLPVLRIPISLHCCLTSNLFFCYHVSDHHCFTVSIMDHWTLLPSCYPLKKAQILATWTLVSPLTRNWTSAAFLMRVSIASLNHHLLDRREACFLFVHFLLSFYEFSYFYYLSPPSFCLSAHRYTLSPFGDSTV